MGEKEFEVVLESIREAGQIWRGERIPAGVRIVADPNVEHIRRSLEMTQVEFATLLGIDVGVVRNWEQGKSVAKGAARVLLRIAETHPDILMETLQI